MSHAAEAEVVCNNPDALAATAEKLGLKMLQHGTHKMYDGREVTGIGFKLEGWSQNVLIDDAGKVYYDNYRGNWGDIEKLDQFFQRYSLEASTIEAKKKGYSTFEVAHEDGSIELLVQRRFQ